MTCTRLHLISLFFLVVLASAFGLLARPVSAACTCYDDQGEAYKSPDSNGIEEDQTALCDADCSEYLDSINVPFDHASTDPEAALDLEAQAAEAQIEQNIAAGTCTCYCGDNLNGAMAEEGTYQLVDECKAICESAGKSYVTCASAAGQLPVSNALCWKADECAKAEGTWSDEQPVECEKNYHYCYPVVEPITLAVNLGGISTVLDIGTYISAIFNYGLGIAAIIAVIMIMIGGMQYIIGSRGGGGSEEVSKGKERIKNAIIGLVLILASYTLLATVNPALVRFKILRLPLIKPALFVTGSCEDFAGQGYRVVRDEEGEEECGATGNIIADPNGTSVTTSCTYERCADGESLCSKVGGEYACMTCDDAGDPDFLTQGFQASPANCASLTPPEDGDYRARCVYQELGQITQVVGSAFSTVSGSVLTTNFCSKIGMACNQITTCSGYAAARVDVGGAQSALIGGTAAHRLNDSNYLSADHSEFRSICEDNLCAHTVTDGPCRYVEASNTCVGAGQ